MIAGVLSPGRARHRLQRRRQGQRLQRPVAARDLPLPPYYHNGACETLACVVGNVRHRTANNTRPDVLANPADVTRVVRFLETIGAATRPLP